MFPRIRPSAVLCLGGEEEPVDDEIFERWFEGVMDEWNIVYSFFSF